MDTLSLLGIIRYPFLLPFFFNLFSPLWVLVFQLLLSVIEVNNNMMTTPLFLFLVFFHFEICLFLLFLFVQFMPPIAPFSISHEENTGILLWIDCVVWLFVFAFPLLFSRNRKLVDKNFLVYLGSIMRMMQYTQQLLSLVYKLFEWMLSRERKIL